MTAAHHRYHGIVIFILAIPPHNVEIFSLSLTNLNILLFCNILILVGRFAYNLHSFSVLGCEMYHRKFDPG